MSTHTHAPSALTIAPLKRLRRLVAIVVLAPLLAVSACSGDDPITALTVTPASTGTTDAGTESVAPTTSENSGTSAVPAALPTWTRPNATIKDPVLGHVITVDHVVRNVPWPEGNPVAQSAFEIVAVRVKVTAGSRYTADVNPSYFTAVTSKSPSAVSTSEFGPLMGNPLKTVNRAQMRIGWIYFKVNRGSDQRLSLQYNRPMLKVSTTGQTIPSQTFTVELAK